MTTKDKYKEKFCDNKDIYVFFQPWWLDTVCNEMWDVLKACDGANNEAYMPIHVYKKYGITSIRPPAFTPYCGIIYESETDEKLHTKYKLENDICECFATSIDKMKLDACFYTFKPEFFCATPFVQHGFSAELRYTYRINIADMDTCFENFSKTLRKKLRKCFDSLVCETENYDLRQLYGILHQVYAKQNKPVPYSFELYQSVVENSLQNNQGQMFVVKDKQGNVNSHLFVIWDNKACYALIGANDQSYLQNNAGIYAQYLSMTFAHNMGIKQYDTEGSMLKGVEEYFMQFSGIRTPYIYITKYYNNIYKSLRTLLKK